MLNERILNMILIAILFLSLLATVSIYTPRHRIVRCECINKIWYTPQETTIWWLFWKDMQYATSPYVDMTYRFDTLEEARKFLDSLHEDKVKKTVVE